MAALDIVEVGAEINADVGSVAGVYFGVGGQLDLGWLSLQIGRLPADSHWQALARVAMRDDLSSLARALARSVLRTVLRQAQDERGSPSALLDAWEAQRSFQLARCRQLLADLKPTPALDMAMLSVLLRELRSLV
jgi:glutamate dehydrogenase